MKCTLMNKNTEIALLQYNEVWGEFNKIYEIIDINYAPLILKKYYEENNILQLVGCFESYANHDKNKVLNKLTMNTGKVLDNNNNEMSYNDNILDIIKHISKLEHQMIRSDIIILGDEYYVIVSLNINW